MKNNKEGITSAIRESIRNNYIVMGSDVYFANEVRNYFVNHPMEYTQLLKEHHNDFQNLVCDLTVELNKLLIAVPVKNKEYATLENENNTLAKKIQQLIAEGTSITDPVISSLQQSIVDIQKKLKKMDAVEEKDLSYKSTQLSGLINKMGAALSEIVPDSEPSDIDNRAKVVFEKKMDLATALFTILWNTRHETLPISVMNIKGWAARLAQRIVDGEHPTTNTPTMLIFRSRTDNGSIKGSSGKSTIAYSCCDLLKKKGLNVADQNYSVKMPTYERIDKNMSDKTLVLMEDITFKSALWEEMNNFLDGLPIKNRGKYQKEGAVFGFGNVLATTNYDLPYTNTKRYPVIEFTPNDAAIASNHPIVVEHANYIHDKASRKFDFQDAWETILAYAQENRVEWLSEYENNRDEVASQCSVQRSKLENLILAFLQSEHVAGRTSCFFASEVLEYIRNNFKGELSQPPKMASLIRAFDNLGIEQYNEQTNIYLKSYKIPTSPIDANENKDGIEYIWKWLNEEVKEVK